MSHVRPKLIIVPSPVHIEAHVAQTSVEGLDVGVVTSGFFWDADLMSGFAHPKQSKIERLEIVPSEPPI